MHYLYRIVNRLNHKVYIGQTVDEKRRWNAHKSFAKNPEQTGQYIHRSMAKYGIENFIYEVIATCRTQEDADETEAQLIKQYDSRNKKYGYNRSPGGDLCWNRGLPKEEQPMYGKRQSEYQKQRTSESHKGKLNSHSLEWSAKVSAALSGKKKNEKWKEKIAKAQTKFSDAQEVQIVNAYETGSTAKELSEQWGCSKRTIFNIVNRQRRFK